MQALKAITLIVCLVCTSSHAYSAPTLAIIVTERIRGFGGGFEQPGHAESLLAQEYSEMGFHVVDAATVRSNLTRQRAELLIQGDENAARQLALSHDAEYILVGTADTRPSGSELFDTQMKSIQANINARLIRSSDGRLLGTGRGQAAKVHVDELQGGLLAIEAACEKIIVQLTPTLQDLYDESMERDGGTISNVYISGLLSFQHLDFIMEFLESGVSGVDAVELISYSNGVAEVSIAGSVAPEGLALKMARKKFQSFKIEPFHVTGNRIDAKIIMRN